MSTIFQAGVIAVMMASSVAFPALGDVLPSWSKGDNRDAIVAFVGAVTAEGTATYLAPKDRIAVFDNDGTLWTEKPTYTEVIFAFEQVKALAPNHPEWQEQEPFAQILESGLGALKEIGLKGAITALTAVYAELDDAELAARVADFMDDPHMSAGRNNEDTTFAPMVEMVEYLRENGFEIFIVSGGTNNFLRSFSETAYGVSPRRVVGSVLEAEVVMDDTGVSLKQLPKLAYFNDGTTKVLNIVNRIGTHPTIVVGNSDGDLPMIQYALAGVGPKLAVLVNHDDDAREAAYDRGAETAIAAAAPDGDNFLLISMKNDFAEVWKP